MKRFSLFSLSLCLTAVLQAETVPGLKVVMEKSRVEVALSDIHTITYPTESTVLFTMTTLEDGSKSGEDVTFELADILRIVFVDIEVAPPSGISQLASDTNSDGALNIYNIDGRLVRSTDDCRHLNEAVRELPVGTYIISCQGKTIKVTR